MKSFRDHVEGYEDLVFTLEQPLIIPTNNNYQNRGNCRLLLMRLHLIGTMRGCQWILN